MSAPGGWFRDGFGTPTYRTPGNLVLAPYPLAVAQSDVPPLADETGNPVDDFSVVSCDARGRNCGFYTYLQGTSMASPHVAGVAALIVAGPRPGELEPGLLARPGLRGVDPPHLRHGPCLPRRRGGGLRR